MRLLLLLANGLVLLGLPWLLVGVIGRTKARWAGRIGPPLLQSAWDVLRLLGKRPVYSRTATAVFRLTPYVGLAVVLVSSAVVPLLGTAPVAAFAYDFVFFAYLWGLGRVAIMLGALDTGSSFEGMGASREATFATLVEPALLLVLGALGAVTGTLSLSGALSVELDSVEAVVAWAASLSALLIIVQTEGARMPVDDPTTHLELTMIHEVMVLDHSGPELAAIQTTSALKLMLGISLIATLVNPWAGVWTGAAGAALCGLANILLSLLVAVLIGTVESLVARFRLTFLHRYLFTAVVGGAIALLATTWQGSGS